MATKLVMRGGVLSMQEVEPAKEPEPAEIVEAAEVVEQPAPVVREKDPDVEMVTAVRAAKAAHIAASAEVTRLKAELKAAISAEAKAVEATTAIRQELFKLTRKE